MSNVSSWLPNLLGVLEIDGNGVPCPTLRAKLNFVGCTVVDNPALGRTDITPPAGGGSAPSGTGWGHVTGGGWDAGAASPITFSGDSTSASTALVIPLVITKINGTSIPAGGALITGNAAYVSGGSAATYSALNLAGGSGWVTGVLPLANGGTNASTGLTTANGVVTSSGTALQQASNVLAGSGFISVGATPATVGNIRLANAGDIRARDVGNTSDRVLLSTDSSNEMFVGTDPGFAATQWGVLRLAAGFIYIGTTVNQDVILNGSSFASLNPMIGQSSPYGVHGTFSKTLTAAQTYTLSAADYAMTDLQFISNGVNVVILPAPATAAGTYWKFIHNVSGGGTIQIKDSNAAVAAATLANGNGAWYRFSSAGPKQVSPAFAVA